MTLNNPQKNSILIWLGIAITVLILCSSCKKEKIEIINKRAFILESSEDNNWSTASTIYCDSVQMINPNQCYYYIDGHKFNFYSKMIKLHTNEN